MLLPIITAAAVIALELPFNGMRSMSFNDALGAVIVDHGFWVIVAFGFVCAIYPITNFLALLVFFQTNRRTKVRPGHVLRCAVYSGDVIFWFALYVTAIFIVVMLAEIAGDRFEEWLFIGGLAAYVISFHRLEVAYRRYLKFPAAFVTILASQIIVCLLLFTIVLYAIEY